MVTKKLIHIQINYTYFKSGLLVILLLIFAKNTAKCMILYF